MNQYKETVLKRAEDLREQLSSICRTIHENPELGFEEYKSSRLLTDFLEAQGFQVTRGCGGLDTAFRAKLTGNGKSNETGQNGHIRQNGRATGTGHSPVIGILCEYDALPGIGHACGHNIIAAASVGAAAAAASVLKDFDGTIVVLGTPSEEGSGGGKQILWDKGVMDDIDLAMMFHPGPQTVIRDKTLAIQALRFTFHGQSAHGGAAQEKGRNAVEAVIQTFNGINSLRGHLKKDVNIHGIITKGGTATNIIPDLGEAEFGVRASTMEELADVVERVSCCAKGAALMTGCTVDITHLGVAYADLITNETLLGLMESNLEALNIPIDVREAPAALASTDVGNLSHHIPAIQCMIGIGSKALPHTKEFAAACAGEAGVKIAMNAARALACTVVDLLESPELVKKAQEELEERKKHVRF